MGYDIGDLVISEFFIFKAVLFGIMFLACFPLAFHVLPLG